MNVMSQTIVSFKALVMVMFSAMVFAQGCAIQYFEVGAEGNACYPDETCNQGLVCLSDLCVNPETECVPDCDGLNCGSDPVCGQSCGICDHGHSCRDGDCVKDVVWEPDGYVVRCSSGMCEIPGGSFWMGCNSDVDTECESDEMPYHEVTLGRYYMDKTEVTVDQYAGCVTDGSCTPPHTGGFCNWGVSGKGSNPVNCVNWIQAGEFCAWAGKRLPTEAEWEKAARGTDGRKFPWGNDVATCQYAVMYSGKGGCGTGGTWNVCSKTAGNSPYGLCDMAGNVYEWVSDWYDSKYYVSSPSSSPTGPVNGLDRVNRGASFQCFNIRVSSRFYNDPEYSGVNHWFTGFRCAKDAQ